MKLWLLDADVTIKLLELGVLDSLAKQHKIHVASTVASEVKYYKKSKQKIQVDFRKVYIDTGKKRITASLERRRREPYDIVLIVCEGAKTEPLYFTHRVNYT